MTMSNENIADGTVETPSVEDLQARLKEAEARYKWAEAKVVELKKSETKEVRKEKKEEIQDVPQQDPYEIAKKVIAEEKFFESNKDLVDYKEDITKLASNWLSYDEAKEVILKRNPDIANRKVAQNSNFTSWDFSDSKVTYTIEELGKLPQAQYNKVVGLQKQGKVTFI